MGGRVCRHCDRTGDAEVYCRHCADEVMARALNLPFHGPSTQSTWFQQLFKKLTNSTILARGKC